MSGWDAWVGKRESSDDRLTPALVRRFRATLDAADDGSPFAPDGIHWCLCPPEVATAALDRDGHPRRGGFLPPVPLPRRMWASSEVHFLAPIRIGADVERRSTVVSVAEKQGRTGPLVFVEVEHEVRSDGVAYVRERQSLVYRDAGRATAATPAEPAPPEEWEWERLVTPNEPLLFRYSALTFNSHRIHYDQPYTTQVEGYDGLVVHGPLIATLLLDLATRHLGSNALSRFTFRAQSPAIANQPIRLLGRPDGGEIRLEAQTENGRLLLSARAAR